jgi:methionyl-tRNA synthetase
MRKASQLLMEIAQCGNIYFDQQQPWKLIKDETKGLELENVLYHCLECIKLLALVGYPIMPTSSQKIFTLLGFSQITDYGWEEIVKSPVPVEFLKEPSLVFSKVEDEVIAQEIEKLQRSSEKKLEPQVEPLKEAISIDQVDLLDLRVGTVLEASRVPKSDKLLQLMIDIGLETRQVVAGIGKSYAPESLIGKKVVLVANLKPAKLMGVQSQGMVLAGGNGQLLELPTLQTLPNGSRVK